MNGSIAVERRLAWDRTPQDRRKTELIQIFNDTKELVRAAEQFKQNLYSPKNLLWVGIVIASLAVIGMRIHPTIPVHGPASYLWSGFHRVRG